MKINKLAIALGLFLGVCGSSWAQSNGSFLGRRVLFNFTTNFSPAWGNPNFFDNSDHWQRYYAFNFDISPGVEVIAWKKGTVGAVYHWFKTKFDYPEYLNSFEGYSPVEAPLNVHGFGIYYKQYIGRKSRAPIGTYWRFQLDGFFYSAQASSSVTGNLFAFKAEFGHDFLFFDRLRVSAGFSFGLPFCRWRYMNYGQGSSPRYLGFLGVFDDDSGALNDYVNARLLGHYYIGFVLSIGILAF
jgi:hypothetical protein